MKIEWFYSLRAPLTDNRINVDYKRIFLRIFKTKMHLKLEQKGREWLIVVWKKFN